MDQWLYSISDHCIDDLTNYRQNCHSSIVDGIVFASDVKRCALSYFASVSSSEADNMEAKDWGWSIEHNMCVPIRSSLPPAPDELLKTIYCRCKTNCDQNAVTVESMVWNVLSLALNAEEIHVATCLHAKIRTLIQTNS